MKTSLPVGVPGPECSQSMRRPTPRLFPSGLRALILMAGLAAAAATLPAQVVSHGFEDGTLQGWTPFGAPTLTNTTEAAHTGTHSLKTTNRTATFNGPSLDLAPLLIPGATYQISGWARLVSGTDTVKFTVQHGTGGSFNGVAQAVADDTGWVQLQGTFNPTTSDSVIRLYLESNNATSAYYLDDVAVLLVSPPPAVVVTHGFEDGTTQGWRPRFGSPVVTNTTAAARTGTHSVVTTNRTQTFNGPALDVRSLLQPDNIYQIGGWVRLVAGQAPAQLKISMQKDFSDGTATTFLQVTPALNVTDAAWVQLQGTFSFTGSNVSALTLYLESPNSATASFYLDDFTIAVATVVPPPFTPTGPPIATGQPKFLGSAYSPAQSPNFDKYWNQVTPENAGKWGAVEPTRDTMNWSGLDDAYHAAKDHGFPFRMHTLIWGAQQPAWMESLPAAEQLEEIREWFAAVAERYPDIDFIDVVNEPLHNIPAGPGRGSYLDALGGAGATGWDWVITSFQLAREFFPQAVLELNEYGLENDQSAVLRYIEIIELLQERGLIDAVGTQGHAFNTRVPAATIIDNLDLLASTGLPIYVTELDIDGPSDGIQLADYQRIFPAFWEHPAVQGVTLWGYRPGHWRTAEGAYIVFDNGAERPAMQWLQSYVRNKPLFASQPQDASVTLGGTATFSAVIGDVPNPQFQWFKGDAPIPGATGPTLTLTNVRPADVGVYHVVVTNDIYSTRSVDATLSLASRALVNHAPSLNSSDVDGSIQQRLGESVSLNGNTAITGDLLVPGLPTVRLNGQPAYGGTQDGTGAATPANYTVTLNSHVTLGHVIRRTDPVPLPVVNAPAAPAGTRNVVLNKAGQSVGSWSTVRNLTLNSNVGPVAVPPGDYGTFTVNGGGSLILGIEGATEPSVYAFQSLTLNSQAGISVVGPVIVTLTNSMNVNGGSVGASSHPEWLTLNLAAGGVTLNSGAGVFGYVSAPAGAVVINGNCLLEGGLAADRLTVNSNGMLHLVAANPN